jgi:hypothetical protein
MGGPGGKALLSYMEECRLVQEQFRQVLTQVAGYSLLIMTRKVTSARLDGPMLVARKAAGRAHEHLLALKVPAAAAHHYHHLLKASEAIRAALAAAEACTTDGPDKPERAGLSRALKAATAHLRATARLLPGFEIVDFGQGCCAACPGASAGLGEQNRRQLGGSDGGLFDLGA